MKKIIIILFTFNFPVIVTAQQGELIGVSVVVDNNCNGVFEATDTAWPGIITYNLVNGSSPVMTLVSNTLGQVFFTLASGQTATISFIPPPGCTIKLPLFPVAGSYTIISNCLPGGPPCMGQQRQFLICCGGGSSTSGTGGTTGTGGMNLPPPIVQNNQDTTQLTSNCTNPGFENGQQISWSDWHAGYGSISGNSSSLDILNNDYSFS